MDSEQKYFTALVRAGYSIKDAKTKTLRNRFVALVEILMKKGLSKEDSIEVAMGFFDDYRKWMEEKYRKLEHPRLYCCTLPRELEE